MFPASSSELRELHNALRANISYHMEIDEVDQDSENLIEQIEQNGL